MQKLSKTPAPAVSVAASGPDSVGGSGRLWRVLYMQDLLEVEASRLIQMSTASEGAVFEETLIQVDTVQKSGASIYYAPARYQFATRTREGVRFFDTHAEAYRSENW